VRKVEEKEDKKQSMNEILYQIELEKAEKHRERKGEVQESVKGVVISTIITQCIFYFSHLDAFKWCIPVILFSSIISVIFVDDDKKRETEYFFGLWMGIAVFTLFASFIITCVYFLVK
jgi:hypothetical protein